jgi:hypothetical protein
VSDTTEVPGPTTSEPATLGPREVMGQDHHATFDAPTSFDCPDRPARASASVVGIQVGASSVSGCCFSQCCEVLHPLTDTAPVERFCAGFVTHTGPIALRRAGPPPAHGQRLEVPRHPTAAAAPTIAGAVSPWYRSAETRPPAMGGGNHHEQPEH